MSLTVPHSDVTDQEMIMMLLIMQQMFKEHTLTGWNTPLLAVIFVIIISLQKIDLLLIFSISYINTVTLL